MGRPRGHTCITDICVTHADAIHLTLTLIGCLRWHDRHSGLELGLELGLGGLSEPSQSLTLIRTFDGGAPITAFYVSAGALFPF